MDTAEISFHAVRLWQHLLDMLALCECGGKLVVRSPVINGIATVRCNLCPQWYRYELKNDQLYCEKISELWRSLTN